MHAGVEVTVTVVVDPDVDNTPTGGGPSPPPAEAPPTDDYTHCRQSALPLHHRIIDAMERGAC